MQYIKAKPIESIRYLAAAERNAVVKQLVDLFFKEIFVFKFIQTDPNFANFYYQPESQKIVLFDFGATREVPPALSRAYRALFKAGSDNDRDGVRIAAIDIGYFTDAIEDDYQEQVLDLFLMACEPLRCNGEFDFKNSELASKIKQAGLQLGAQSQQWHTPPVDALFIHRKLAGLYLIAARLEAKIDARLLFSHY